jgi:hypothetical protein
MIFLCTKKNSYLIRSLLKKIETFARDIHLIINDRIIFLKF